MEFLLWLICILLMCIAGFYMVCHIIKLWTGCNDKEAVTKLYNFLNGKVQYSFSNDMGFANDVWENVKNVIGDKRFEQLIKLSNTVITTPLLFFGESSGLPYIAVCLYYEDENEKRVLENILINVVKMYLQMYGYDLLIFTDWKMRYDLNMPYLEIKYARTQEEKRIMNIILHNNQKNIIAKNSAVIDDTEDSDLDG